MECLRHPILAFLNCSHFIIFASILVKFFCKLKIPKEFPIFIARLIWMSFEGCREACKTVKELKNGQFKDKVYFFVRLTFFQFGTIFISCPQ